MTAQSEKRRKRRIAADEAHAWARNLRLKNPFAKSVLQALTGYVDGDGFCFVGIEQLAEDTDLSMDTVRKRLVWLERVGAIARFAQWVDASGERNGEGRGKRTSDKIRLLIDASTDEIEAFANGDGAGQAEPEPIEISPSPRLGPAESQESVSPPLALGQPSDSGEGPDSSEPEPEILSQSPITPDGEEAGQPRSEESEKAAQEAFERFERNYPIPLDDVLTVRRLLAALTVEERDDAIAGALGYKHFVRDEKRKPWNATKFLRQRRWPGYVQLGRDRMPKPPPPRYFVPKDSPAYQGILVLYAIMGQPPPRAEMSVVHGCEGIFRNSEPSAGLIALAKVYGQPIDTAIVENTKRWNAWRERLHECHAPMPLARTLRKIGEEERDKDSKMVVKLPKIFRGARFPSCWPPTKGEREQRAA